MDLKGQNVVQRSSLGIAFRVVDGETYDGIYFRPINFRHENELNRSHGVQYISHPVHTWNKLRTETPGQYEHAVAPAPDPDGWFHARIVVSGPRVQVFVNDAADPSLSVETLSRPRGGPVGLWVGSGSGGAFANLRITPSPCAAPEHAQFDFWIGDWDVLTPSGTQAGTNTITREINGCALVERWHGSRGMVGTSLNIYTPATGTWHQTWVDSLDCRVRRHVPETVIDWHGAVLGSAKPRPRRSACGGSRRSCGPCRSARHEVRAVPADGLLRIGRARRTARAPRSKTSRSLATGTLPGPPLLTFEACLP